VHGASQRQQATVSDEMQRLQAQYPLVSHGRIIVSTWEPHSAEARALIEELGLNLQISLNKGAVMILPTGVDKASGIEAVARELKTSLSAIVGVGDAENDLPFLNRCGYSVAVANALPEVKSHVDDVTQAARGMGVVELIGRLLAS